MSNVLPSTTPQPPSVLQSQPLQVAATVRACNWASEPDADDLADLVPTDPRDERWDAMFPDDDLYEPAPEPGDFWIDADGEEDCAMPLAPWALTTGADLRAA